MKIKKGDTIRVLRGKDRGKTGSVERVYPGIKKVLITGINVFKKNLKPSRRHPHGGIIDINRPMQASSVMVMCPRCSKATRVSYMITKEGKLRICRKCKESVDAKA